MVEAGAKQVSEEDMLQAIMFGHEEIKRLIAFQEEIQKDCGKEKMHVELFEVDKEVEKEVYEYAYDRLVAAIKIKDKLERYKTIDDIKEETVNKFMVDVQNYLTGREISLKTNAVFINATK